MPFPLQQFLFRIPHHLYGTNACSIGVSVPHPLAARMAELLRRTLQIAKWLWRCAFQRTFAALFLQTFLCVAAHVCRAVAKSREGRILPRAGAFRRYPVTGTEVFCFRLMAGCERAWQGPLLRGIVRYAIAVPVRGAKDEPRFYFCLMAGCKFIKTRFSGNSENGSGHYFRKNEILWIWAGSVPLRKGRIRSAGPG